MIRSAQYLIIVLFGMLFSGSAAAAPRPAITEIDAPSDILLIGVSFT